MSILCQNAFAKSEKRWTANQRFSSMKFSMYKRSSLVEQPFSLSTEIWAEQIKKHPVSLVLNLKFKDWHLQWGTGEWFSTDYSATVGWILVIFFGRPT